MNTRTLNAMRVIVSVLAALGIVLCLAGSVAIWFVELRIDRARKKAFERVDQAFSNIDTKLIAARDRAVESKIAVADLQQGIQDWARKEVREQLAGRPDVDVKVQMLIRGLQQADLMLEFSQDTLQHIGQALDVGNDLGIAVNTDSVVNLVEKVSEIKNELNRAIEMAEGIGKRIDEIRDDEIASDRKEQVVAITARLIATFGKIDSRIVSFRDDVAEMQNNSTQFSSKTHRGILAIATCFTFFTVWMLAGQVCLWRWARSGRVEAQ